jgi:hypothetical protein
MQADCLARYGTGFHWKKYHSQIYPLLPQNADLSITNEYNPLLGIADNLISLELAAVV